MVSEAFKVRRRSPYQCLTAIVFQFPLLALLLYVLWAARGRPLSSVVYWRKFIVYGRQIVWMLTACTTGLPLLEHPNCSPDVDFVGTVRLWQGCPQDVKSQDRDETRRDVPKNVSRPQCRSLKTPTGEVCHFTNCFLRVRSIIFFMIYPQTWCIACMFTRLKSRDRDRDVISSRPRRDRDVRFFQTLETKTRPSKKRLETASRPRRSRPRLHPWVVSTFEWFTEQNCSNFWQIILTYKLCSSQDLF